MAEKVETAKHMEKAEAIMGQYIFAAGCGAAGQWVKLEAIQELRDHYLKSIYRAVEKGQEWKDDSSHVLHYMQVIGRLAARKATEDGRASIDKRTMAEAVFVVEANYKGEPGSDEQGPRCGVWCE